MNEKKLMNRASDNIRILDDSMVEKAIQDTRVELWVALIL